MQRFPCYLFKLLSIAMLQKKPHVSSRIVQKERDGKILLIHSERPSSVVVSKPMADLLGRNSN